MPEAVASFGCPAMVSATLWIRSTAPEPYYVRRLNLAASARYRVLGFPAGAT